MKSSVSELAEPFESLYRIQRALVGHVSYLAACEANMAFTEYLLYEPILRVLQMRKYSVQCEYSCQEFLPVAQGDHKRLDFVVQDVDRAIHFALEVKWPTTKRGKMSVVSDHTKLAAFKIRYPAANSFLCVFGRRSHIGDMQPVPGDFAQDSRLPPIFADFRRTQFGCKIYELKPPAQVPIA